MLEPGWCTEIQKQGYIPPPVLMGVCHSCSCPSDHCSHDKENNKPILTYLPLSVGFTWKKTPTHKFLFLLHSRITHKRVWKLWISVQWMKSWPYWSGWSFSIGSWGIRALLQLKCFFLMFPLGLESPGSAFTVVNKALFPPSYYSI